MHDLFLWRVGLYVCVMMVLVCEVGVLGGRGAGRQSTAYTTHLKAVKDGQRVHVGPQDAHRDVVIQLRKAGGTHSGPRPAHVTLAGEELTCHTQTYTYTCTHTHIHMHIHMHMHMHMHSYI
jgi:hypothetical protein